MDLLSKIDHPILLAALVLACVPVYGLWAWVFFGSVAKAAGALRWVFVRDTKSFLEGDYVEDKLAEWRLAALAGCCVASVVAAYQGVLVILG